MSTVTLKTQPVYGLPSAHSATQYDDEFLLPRLSSRWNILGTIPTINTTDMVGQLHLKNPSIGYQLTGIYEAAPTTLPFTVTTSITNWVLNNSFVSAGLLFLKSDLSLMSDFVWLYGGYTSSLSDVAMNNWTGISNRSTNNNSNVNWPGTYPVMFSVRIVSASSWTGQYSTNGGTTWSNYANNPFNPGYVPGYIGLALAGETAGGYAEAYFDNITVTLG